VLNAVIVARQLYNGTFHKCWDDSMIPFFVFIECQNIGNNEDRKDDEFQDV
jgi:hypothetical protein